MASWTGYFYIESAASGAGACYGLSVQGSPQPGASVVLWPWKGGQQNELWSIDDNGHITSALAGGLVLGLGPAEAGVTPIVLTAPSRTDPSQMWSFSAQGTIVNKADTGVVLAVSGGVGVEGASIVAAALEAGEVRSQVWSIAPIVPVGQVTRWCFVQSGLSQTGENACYYGLHVTKHLAKLQVVLSSWSGGQPAELWRFTDDGHLLSALGADGNLTLGLGLPVEGAPKSHYVGVEPLVSGAVAQTWSQQNGTICNGKSGDVLTVQGGVAVLDTPIITAAPDGAAAQQWQLVPAFPLLEVLAQAPEPFPVFVGDEAAAYASINTQLKLPDTGVRGEYVILQPATLTSLKDSLAQCTCPPGVSSQAWDAVVTQLTDELTCAVGVQEVVTSYLSFHTAMFSDQQAIVSQYGTDAQMDAGTTIHGSALAIFSAVAEAGLNLIPDGGAIAAFINAGVVISQVADSATPIPDSFQVAYSALWGQLSTNFESLYTAVLNMAYVALSDWGKLRALYPLTLSTAVGGLALTTAAVAAIVKTSTPYFKQSVLQMLLPAKYHLWYGMQQNAYPVSCVPKEAQNVTPDGSGWWYATWITAIESDRDFPSQDVWNDVTGLGIVNPEDFWMAQNGWNFAKVANYVPPA
jgi:hypothetical protein